MDSVVSGEAVVLEVPVARFPSRMLAIAIDIGAQLVALAIVLIAVGTAQASGGLDAASAAAIGLSVTVLIIVGYPTIFETLSRGRTLGKLAMGLRVVGDDGGPERFRQALVRALASVLEIWMLMGAPALIASLLSVKGKRLGDVFAGTFVIQERLRATSGDPVVMPPMLAAWAASLELSGLPGETAAIARSYLSRFLELTPVAREEFGRRIATEVAARVSPPPPPGTPPAAYLAAVLAERRAREVARMNWAAQGAGNGPWQARTVPGPGPTELAPLAARRAARRPAAPGPAAPAGGPGPSPASPGPVAHSGTGEPTRNGGFTPPA